MFLDPLYFIMVMPAFLLALYASFKVKSNFRKYSQVYISNGYTGAEAAARMLHYAGINDVQITRHEGFLSDHYDPSTKTIKLSPEVYDNPSIAAVGVACHEAGHAIQHAHRYAPLSLRTAIVPFASFGSNMAWVFIIIGSFIAYGGGFNNIFIKIGVILYTFVVAFQLITLPVEFNASSRAKELIIKYNIASPAELKGVKKVLNAAALTYVAAAASAVLELLYFLLRFGLLSSDD